MANHFRREFWCTIKTHNSHKKASISLPGYSFLVNQYIRINEMLQLLVFDKPLFFLNDHKQLNSVRDKTCPRIRPTHPDEESHISPKLVLLS